MARKGFDPNQPRNPRTGEWTHTVHPISVGAAGLTSRPAVFSPEGKQVKVYRSTEQDKAEMHAKLLDMKPGDNLTFGNAWVRRTASGSYSVGGFDSQGRPSGGVSLGRNAERAMLYMRQYQSGARKPSEKSVGRPRVTQTAKSMPSPASAAATGSFDHTQLSSRIGNLPKGKKFGFQGHTIDNIPSKGYRVRLKGEGSRHYDRPEDAARAVLQGKHFTPGGEDNLRQQVEQYSKSHPGLSWDSFEQNAADMGLSVDSPEYFQEVLGQARAAAGSAQIRQMASARTDTSLDRVRRLSDAEVARREKVLRAGVTPQAAHAAAASRGIGTGGEPDIITPQKIQEMNLLVLKWRNARKRQKSAKGPTAMQAAVRSEQEAANQLRAMGATMKGNYSWTLLEAGGSPKVSRN